MLLAEYTLAKDQRVTRSRAVGRACRIFYLPELHRLMTRHDLDYQPYTSQYSHTSFHTSAVINLRVLKSGIAFNLGSLATYLDTLTALNRHFRV
jgi:hypothetical protein